MTVSVFQMPRYRAWRIENGEKVQEIQFEAKSLRAAKARATKDLVVEYGVWTEGTVFLPSGEPVTGWTKSEQGRAGALGFNPKIDLIQIEPTQETSHDDNPTSGI